MNSYNENLHFAIVNSLQSLDIEEQNLKSQVNASMFTLYHAEGAKITSEQNLAAAKETFIFKTLVQDETVKDSNVSVNVLASATQASQYVKQATSNVAVCASNVQIAANSIVRLASDIGSIFSIVNAADFDSDIYLQAENARELMNHTAYDAEVASQLAMEASMLTAEVSASTVLDMAKATNTLMTSVLKITTADFDTATQNIALDNAALSVVRTTEKLDEGSLELVSVEYKAAKSAYELTNKELNLDLRVKTSNKNDLSFTVDFDLIKSPFSVEGVVGNNPIYPVKEYYMMIVKESKKQTFSISNAENLLLNATGEVIAVDQPKKNHVSQVVNVYTNGAGSNIMPVKDSDGEEITLGVSYVVFVLAIYADDFKRKINCYDDYLSAPSQSFVLTTRLEAVSGKTISIKPFKKDELSDEERSAAESAKNEQQHKNGANGEDGGIIPDYTYMLNFNIKESLDIAVEYRCMLLPFSPDTSNGLLTSESLKYLLDNEINALEQISNEFDPKIAELQADNYEIGLKLEFLGDNLKDLTDQLTAFGKDSEPSNDDAEKQQSLKLEQKAVTTQLNDLQKSYQSNSKQLTDLTAAKQKSTKLLAHVDAAKPGFLFNVAIAEQVYADSYTVARKKSQDDNGEWVAFFGPDTTDNFGNRLNSGEKYLPVILSYSTAAEENAADFVNALSDIANTDYFQY